MISSSSLPWLRLEVSAVQNESHVNKYYGMYICGQSYGISKKLKVSAAYNKAMFRAQREWRLLSINAVAKTCQTD
jgi:hypothetical protein